MQYKYQDFKDKTKEGVEKELQQGLTTIAVYFSQSKGIPLEIFNDWITTKINNRAEQLHFYMRFRNQHPNLFK